MHKKEVFNLEKRYIIILSLLIFFGFYKNAWLLKVNGFYTINDCFKIILLPLISVILGFIYDKLNKEKNYFSTSIYLLLLGMTFPSNTNIFLYLISNLLYLGIIFLFKNKHLPFNLIVLLKVLSIIFLTLINNVNYANLLEQSQEFNYNFLDKLIGFTPSGIFTSSFIFIILGFILLLFDKYYKKEISLLSIGSYLLTLLLISVFKKDMLLFIREALNSLIWFSFILIAPLSIYTPVIKKNRIYYGITLGIITVFISLLTNFYDGVFISLVISDSLRIIYLSLKKMKCLRKN